MTELKERQEKFCQNYVLSRNATKAAIAAGYSDKAAHTQGYRLLQRDDIKERLMELEGEIVTDIDVIAELEQQYETAKLNGNGQTALKALELLARARGNNVDDDTPQDIESLEDDIKNNMYIIGKEKMYELFMATFPEDFEEEEEDDEEFTKALKEAMEENKEVLEQLDD